VTAEHLNRLLGLTAESLVDSRWIKSFANRSGASNACRTNAPTWSTAFARPSPSPPSTSERGRVQPDAARRLGVSKFLSDRLVELEMFDSRSVNLSNRMYDEALACRMRPLRDGVQAFPRLVRDVAQSLGKQQGWTSSASRPR